MNTEGPFDKVTNILPVPMTKLGFVRLTGVGDQWEEDFGHLLESRNCEGELDLSCGNLKDGDVSFFKGYEKVLQQRSGYCRYALELIGNKDPKPVIHFEKISAKNMQRMLNFLYVGHVAMEQDELDGFMETAREMGVTGISSQEYACNLPVLSLSKQDKDDGERNTNEEEDLDKFFEGIDTRTYPGEALISRSIPSGHIIFDNEDEDNDCGKGFDVT